MPYLAEQSILRPCYMCGDPTRSYAQSSPGMYPGMFKVPLCGRACHERYEGERQAVNAVTLWLESIGERDLAKSARDGAWRYPSKGGG